MSGRTSDMVCLLVLLVICVSLAGCSVTQIDSGQVRVNREVFSVGTNKINTPAIIPKQNSYEQCYVSVLVYNSSANLYGLKGATVVALSRTKCNETAYNYTGYYKTQTDEKGQACLAVYCYAEGLVFVEQGSERLFALSVIEQRKTLPPAFRVDIQSNNEELIFHSFVFGIINGKSGPVYASDDKSNCANAGQQNYHFTYSYLSAPDQLVSTPVPTQTSDFHQTLAWRYGISSGDRKTCYIKVKVKVSSDQAILKLRSVDSNGHNLGLFISGPKADPNSGKTDEKAVCLQFRCPFIDVISNMGIPANVDTTIVGSINVAGLPNGCCFRSIGLPGLQVNRTHFSTTILATQSLSPNNGLFQNKDQRYAKSRCYTGRDFLGNEYSMDIDNHYAFEYDCTKTCVLNPLVVG